MKIAIIGAGEIGQAIRKIISKKDFEINMWDKDEKKVGKEQGSLADLVDNATAIFVCIPSNFVRGLIEEISKFNVNESIIVGISKGMESGKNQTNIETFYEIMPEHKKFAIISGPMLAEEIVEDKICGAVIASKDSNSLNILEDIFSGTKLKTTLSKNVLAVSYLGVLKNVYAILCGISDGLNNGYNTKSVLITEAVFEMKEILELLFGNGEDAFGLSGLGDLLTTGSGMFSKNYSYGFEMARDGKSEIMSEGRISIPHFYSKLGKNAERFPLFTAVKEICHDGMNLKEVLKKHF